MEVIKKSSNSPGGKFKVLRPFVFQCEHRKEDIGKKPPGPAMVNVGDILEIKDPIEQVSLCKCGKVFPVLPEIAVYIALRPIVLPGESEKFECGAMELIELKASDAAPLLLNGAILPRDDTIWRPFGKILKQKPRGMSQKQIDEYEVEKIKQKNWEIGILQKGKSK